MEYLTKSERTLRQNYFETLAQQKHLEEFLQTLKKPDDSQKDALNAYEKVVSGVKKKIFALKMSAISMKKSVEKIDKKFELQSKIISPQRAAEMAKNIFVHGNFKKLRFDIRKLKKDEEKFSKNLRAFSFRQKLFQEKDWSADERPIFLQEKYFLIKQKTLLELEKNRLNKLKISLKNRQTELDSLCQKSDSQKKIGVIAAGILRKNFNFVH